MTHVNCLLLRAPDGGELTCSVLRQMRQDVTALEASTLSAMKDSEFRDCLEIIGNASKWTDKQLSELLVKAKQAGELSWTAMQ
jgi:hypothetical protein